MVDINQNLSSLRQQLQQLALQFEQAPAKLIAVSKTMPTAAIRAAHAYGQGAFGENYAHELAAKAQELAHLKLEWHFIGHIQSNKTKIIATYASWVHGLCSLAHALRLNQQRPEDLAPLKVLIEVKLSNDNDKQGLTSYDEILLLATKLVKLPRLELCGLMGMATADSELAHGQFKQLQTYLQQLNNHGFKLKHLSMGMSQDYPQALACGATMLRIGSKIFGPRST